mmetsp:Transcript_18148/g.51682  ORF Transcript_18148/g.51682 Transcript_18148/m.51682 type:complete len:216 (+) Transcript_18148:1145-1792(+)
MVSSKARRRFHVLVGSQGPGAFHPRIGIAMRSSTKVASAKQQRIVRIRRSRGFLRRRRQNRALPNGRGTTGSRQHLQIVRGRDGGNDADRLLRDAVGQVQGSEGCRNMGIHASHLRNQRPAAAVGPSWLPSRCHFQGSRRVQGRSHIQRCCKHVAVRCQGSHVGSRKGNSEKRAAGRRLPSSRRLLLRNWQFGRRVGFGILRWRGIVGKHANSVL